MVLEKKARIISFGAYLPEKILANSDLERLVDTSDEWITTRTGIKERRIAAPDEFCSDLGAKAALSALSAIDYDPKKLDLILVATMTPDYITPSTAALIQTKIGAENAAAFDIQAACSGYIYGLSIARAYILSGMYRSILLVAPEKMSAFVDYTDRKSCVLFGDGAAAALITDEGEGMAINHVCLGAEGELADLISIAGGGSRFPASESTVANNMHYLKISGQEVFKHAVRRMGAAAKNCLDQMGLVEDDIKWLVPHQANGRIIDAIAKQMKLPEEKIYKTLHKYGNTSASSIGIALAELCQVTPPKEAEHLLLVAFGGGLTWGAAALTKINA